MRFPNNFPHMSKPEQRKTAHSVEYVTPSGKSWHIPQGMLCVRAKGISVQNGKKVKNPWVLHQTPPDLVDDQEFSKYAKTYGIIINESCLAPDPAKGKEKWARELRKLCATEYTGTGEDGHGIPWEVIRQWMSDLACNYWEQYTPARALEIWVDVFQSEEEDAAEFAAEFMENCEWELYKQLEEKNVLRCFDFAQYWEQSLRHDYQEVQWEGRCFYVRNDW